MWPGNSLRNCWSGCKFLKYWLPSLWQHLGLASLHPQLLGPRPCHAELSELLAKNANFVSECKFQHCLDIAQLGQDIWSWQQVREAFNCPTLGLAYVTTETCRSGFLGPNTLGYLAKAGLNWGACQNPNARPAASLQVGLGTTLPATQCLGATF